MRLSLGTTDVSASGGTVVLVGRRGSDWQAVSTGELPLEDALEILAEGFDDGAHRPEDLADAVASDADDAPRFLRGQTILWHYGRHIETARVVHDDDDGLVVWIPVGSARLEPVPAAGGHPRDIPLDRRFSVPWVMRESTWTGAGVVRVAPRGRPWSVWFFRDASGTPAGAYINLELPHRRVDGEVPAVFSRDLVLDLWIDAAHAGSEDIWLKDSDELEAAVRQGRFTARQAEAIRSLADAAAADFIRAGSWPLGAGWDRWQPDADLDQPASLPSAAMVVAARGRRGAHSRQG